MKPAFINKKFGYTLLEVLTISVLLAFFLVGFYEGSERMAVAMHSSQNRTEALMQLRRVGNNWRAGQIVTGITNGNFLNGTTYAVASAQSAYTASGSSLTRLAVTVSWSEIDANSTAPRPQHIKDVYFKY